MALLNGSPPHPLTLQMLAWLGGHPRTYGETMDAWRTSCPRLSIWEDALSDQLVCVTRPGMTAGIGSLVVELTPDGRAALARFRHG